MKSKMIQLSHCFDRLMCCLPAPNKDSDDSVFSKSELDYHKLTEVPAVNVQDFIPVVLHNSEVLCMTSSLWNGICLFFGCEMDTKASPGSFCMLS